MRVACNKIIALTYTIVDDKGEVIEAVTMPVHYIHGRNSGLFEKVEKALDGKRVGDRIDVTLIPKEAFGEWDPALTFSDNIENVPPEFHHIGTEAEFRNNAGESIKMVVTHIHNGTITLDGNHPFAGKTITFHIKVESVREPTADELRYGVSTQPHGNPALHPPATDLP